MTAPTDSIPFSQFQGWVRQVNVSNLNPMWRTAFEFAFPGFLTQEHPTDRQWEGMFKMLELGVDHAFWRNRPKRRFCGGDELPSGRYYTTLAAVPDGHDNGTLMRELLAYSVPKISGVLVVADLADDEAIEFLGPPWKKDKSYVLSFVHESDHPSPFILHLEKNNLLRHAFGQDASNGGRYLVPIPYSNTEVSIERVIDLRYPRVQEWFFSTFALRDSEYLVKMDRSGASSFIDLIPAIMSPESGGNHFTESVGLWMRANSVDALVFPSARSDCAVTVKDGVLIDWHGWNLLDYRGAPKLRAQKFVDLSAGWPKKLGQNVRVTVAEAGSPYGGSWIVSGIEEWHEQQLDEQQRAALGE